MRGWIQPDGRQRSHKDFIVERQEMSWDVGVRVGGIVVERGDFLPSVPGEDEG